MTRSLILLAALVTGGPALAGRLEVAVEIDGERYFARERHEGFRLHERRSDSQRVDTLSRTTRLSDDEWLGLMRAVHSAETRITISPYLLREWQPTERVSEFKTAVRQRRHYMDVAVGLYEPGPARSRLETLARDLESDLLRSARRVRVALIDGSLDHRGVVAGGYDSYHGLIELERRWYETPALALEAAVKLSEGVLASPVFGPSTLVLRRDDELILVKLEKGDEEDLFLAGELLSSSRLGDTIRWYDWHEGVKLRPQPDLLALEVAGSHLILLPAEATDQVDWFRKRLRPQPPEARTANRLVRVSDSDMAGHRYQELRLEQDKRGLVLSVREDERKERFEVLAKSLGYGSEPEPVNVTSPEPDQDLESRPVRVRGLKDMLSGQ